MKKKYLIIPSVPTPNGSLHLGHIGGPFLTADILARALQRQGHEATIICGTDSYESFALLQASKENKSPQETCHYYHEKIYTDLQQMDIDLHAFINPLALEWQDKYNFWQNKILNELIRNNNTIVKNEQVWWDQNHQHFKVGCWLKGKCPICNVQTESYFCEKCGAYFKPEDMIIEEKNNLISKNISNLFMRVPSKVNNDVLQDLYANIMKREDNLFRLTANTHWGLSLPPHLNLPEATIYSYGLVFAYFLMMGELYNREKNAFAIDSDVITISCFGIDNAVAFIASTLGITQYCKDYKGFDYYIPNQFYYLDDRKFSKSKRHAIFVREIINKTNASSDIVRFFLASINIRDQIGSFSTDEFITFYNITVDWIENTRKNFHRYGTEPSNALLESHLMNLLKIQNDSLQANCFAPHIAVQTISEWLQLQNNSFIWIKGTALLLFPFMPNLSLAIWKKLGIADKPSEALIHVAPSPNTAILPTYKKIQREDLHEKSLQ